MKLPFIRTLQIWPFFLENENPCRCFFHFLLGIPWHPKQRLYLYASHGLVWLSDAKGCVLLNQESGLVKGQLKYPHYQRILPELDSLTEDTSPYAQTGYSIWSIRMFNSRSLTVVHDIERCSPTIVDILKF